MKVTIKDIAQECGVSISAVSLVLNNRECRISEETRNRILDTAAKYRYRPNKLAVGLLKKQTSTLGLIVPSLSNLFFAELCRGCEMEARRNGYSLMIVSSEEFPNKNVQFIDSLVDSQVDGIVYVSPSSIDSQAIREASQRIESAGIPYVTVDREVTGSTSRSVSVDNALGGYIATRHLLSLGHRRIGCLTGPLCNSTSIQRLAGYKKALGEYHIPYDPQLVLEGDFSVDSGHKSIAYMRGQEATALFCFNDMMAIGAYRAMREYGMKLPQDLSLVGYDDIFITELLETPLTTVNQPAAQIGASAARLLLNQIKGNPEEENPVFIPSLKVRSSTCPPKKL